MKHKLILLGFLGSFTGYLDLQLDECVRRYREKLKEEGSDPDSKQNQPYIRVIEFNDEIYYVYDAEGPGK